MQQTKQKNKDKTLLYRLKKKLWRAIGIAGPGFVTGSSDDDPSGIGTYSIAGAQFGLKLLWLIPFQLPMMFVVQEMCARIGLMSGEGLTSNMKRIFPKGLVLFAVTVLVLANVANIGANIAIMSESLTMLTGLNIKMLSILVALTIIMVEILVSYHVYSKILMALSLSLLAYLATAFIVTQDWLEVARYSFIPHFQLTKEFSLIAAGVIGTTISPYLFFWQTSQEVEESSEQGIIGFSGRYRNKRIQGERTGTFIGMFFSQLIALFIIVTCFSTLHTSGITTIDTAHDAAIALKPLAGQWAYLVFTLGIVGAGFLAIPVLAGSAAYALSEIFDQRAGLLYNIMDAPFFNGIIVLATIIGLGINLIGIHPINTLLYAAVINCISAVPLIALVLILANNKRIMGKHTNSSTTNIIGWFTFAVMLISSALVLFFTFF